MPRVLEPDLLSRNPRTLSTQPMEDPGLLQRRASRTFWIPSSAKLTHKASSTSSLKSVICAFESSLFKLTHTHKQMFDEDWKDKKFGGVEGWWGLFNKEYAVSPYLLVLIADNLVAVRSRTSRSQPARRRKGWSATPHPTVVSKDLCTFDDDLLLPLPLDFPRLGLLYGPLGLIYHLYAQCCEPFINHRTYPIPIVPLNTII
jgi:hypothetical protein